MDVLKYLGNQVRTFNRKFARIKSFNKTVRNKLGKKGVFEETASWLLVALGRFVAEYRSFTPVGLQEGTSAMRPVERRVADGELVETKTPR